MTHLLSLRNVAQDYRTHHGIFSRSKMVRAVDDISLDVIAGKTLGIVGESGCGKSTMGRIAIGLEAPSSGTVHFQGHHMSPANTAAWRASRAKVQLVYQDPLSALDKRLPIARQIEEPLVIHRLGNETARRARVNRLLDDVGLLAEHGQRYPHELSGGQRQRAVLARALASEPALLVCDEPVSALDVSIQAQVVNKLADLQVATGIGMIFISHDLKVVRQVSHEVAVMYLGRIVEKGHPDAIFLDPIHPYTRALVSAVPTMGQRRQPKIVLSGDPPDPANRPSGCAFHPRCAAAVPSCRASVPELNVVAGGRAVACHRADILSKEPVARAMVGSSRNDPLIPAPAFV